MIILEICPKQPFDIIPMTPRGTLGLSCAHITQLMTHPAICTLPFTLHLCYKPLVILLRATKSEKFQISSHDKLQKLHNINLPEHRSRGVLREGLEKQEFPPFHFTFLKKTIKNFFPGIWESIYHIKWGTGRKLSFWYYWDTLWTFLL